MAPPGHPTEHPPSRDPSLDTESLRPGPFPPGMAPPHLRPGTAPPRLHPRQDTEPVAAALSAVDTEEQLEEELVPSMVTELLRLLPLEAAVPLTPTDLPRLVPSAAAVKRVTAVETRAASLLPVSPTQSSKCCPPPTSPPPLLA